MFQRTTAINKIRAMTARKKIIQGGTWAGKTYGIIPILIDSATKDLNDTYTVVAETVPALKGGAIKDFKNIMRDTGRWFEDRWNATDLHYTFGSGIKFEFKSFDSVGKAQAAGKRKKLFINEAPYIAYDIADALIGRTTDDIYIDFNPTSQFWAHDEILPNNDAEFLLLKYTDNEALPDTILNELMIKLDKAYYDPVLGNVEGNIKNSYWANWCRVYIDGEIGNLEGVIFSNWTQCDEIPKEAELLGYGLDWGFTNDPTAASAFYRYDGKIYIDELLYQTGMTNSMIVDKLNDLGVSKNTQIVADSAEPKSIKDLSNAGYYIEGADKGPDSIRAGIDVIQEYDIVVTSSSINTINELRNYRWAVDNSGKRLNVPVKTFNHIMDGWRYFFLKNLQVFKGTGQYSFDTC